MIGTGTRSRSNVFQLNLTEMTCLVAQFDNSLLWHRIFYYTNCDNVVKVSRNYVVRHLDKIVNLTNVVCKECILAKQKKVSFPSKKFTTTKRVETIHIDLSGPYRTRGFYGERYLMIFVDDFTRMMQVSFLNEKYKDF